MPTNNAEVCTKDDEFQTVQCQCAECVEARDPEELEEGTFNMGKPVLVTDDYLVGEGTVRNWSGIVFQCPLCGEEAIMPPGKGCMNCLTPVQFKSYKLTELIKSLG